MPSSFGVAAAQAVRYAYERLVYTAGPLTVPPAVLTIFSAQNWNRPAGPTWQAQLVGIAATRVPDVRLTWSADPPNQLNPVSQGAALALPEGLAMQEMYVAGVQTLMLQVSYTGPDPLPDYHLNYAIAMRRLTAADKILAQRAGLQGYRLTTEEEQALKNLDLAREINGRLVVDKAGLDQLRELVNKGTSPISRSRLTAGLYENRITQGPADLFTITVDTTDNVFAYYRADLDPSRPTRGRFLVLTELAIPLSPPPDIWLRVDRDGQQGYLELRGSAFQQPGGAFDLWVPAVDHLVLRASLASGSTPVEVPIRARVLALEMSEVLAVQFGLVTNPEQLENPITYWKAIAGLV